jgi:outer membrane receptor for ferric coprogen and ferric-rhodotorulic acid
MIATTSNSSYLTNQLLEKEKQKVLARANQNLTSNADYNLAKVRQAEDIASQYTDKQASITAQGYEQDAQAANKAANYNLQQNIKAANINAEHLAAVDTLYNKADQKRVISNASAITDSIRDYVSDRGENIKV